jgi:energy-converting hydrogenase Eha subunit C
MEPLLPEPLQKLVGLGLLGLGLYFAIALVRGLRGYLRYRRVAPTALLTWPSPVPAPRTWLLWGVLAAAVATANALKDRPLSHVVALALMAAYFLGLVPLAQGIRLGLYRDGVWAHRGFVPWAEVARIAFVEAPEIVLLLTARHHAAAFKLPVPPAEYGAVRKILDEKERAGLLRLDPAILGI